MKKKPLTELTDKEIDNMDRLLHRVMFRQIHTSKSTTLPFGSVFIFLQTKQTHVKIMFLTCYTYEYHKHACHINPQHQL